MSTELAPPPPEPHPPAVDLALIDGAVLWLNHATQTSGLRLAAQVSRYVVDTFFAGDFQLLSSKDPHKTASFAALCAREDLQIGQATLYRLVRIGEQLQQLPAEVGESLSLTHHRALLAIADRQHKQDVARLAVQHQWSVAELEARIRAETPTPEVPRGRPPLPAVVKWVAGIERALGPAAAIGDFATGFAALPAAAQGKVRAELAAAQQRLTAFAAAIGSE